MLYRFTYKLGISIPFSTEIASGFYIGHFGGIIINGESVIGKNCNISQGVTLGQSSRGKNKGCPILGDNVYIGPGAKIVGAVKIGNNVAIGANCVVVKDIPDNSVVVGIPGNVISQDGSVGYVIRTDYDDKIRKNINF
jgi:serine O-acetyltransferase